MFAYTHWVTQNILAKQGMNWMAVIISIPCAGLHCESGIQAEVHDFTIHTFPFPSYVAMYIYLHVCATEPHFCVTSVLL